MIIQITVWRCDKCGQIKTVTKEVDVYSDPLVTLPDSEEWDYIEIDGEELLACSKCLAENKDAISQPL